MVAAEKSGMNVDMNTFFTGCTHFGHANIIKLANRPFVTVEEMNEALVQRWNEKVKPSDLVYHLGDIAWGPVQPWIERLNGQKTIILGNHDKRTKIEAARDLFVDVRDYQEIEAAGTRFVLFHYPIDDWNRRYRGSIHLHCHTHAPTFRNPNIPSDWSETGIVCNRFNVGVDACGFAPVSLDEILAEARRV